MPADLREIEANELLFLEQHRSAVWDLGAGRLFVSSDRDVRTWNFIGSLSESGGGWQELLQSCEDVFADWKMTPCLKVTPFSPRGLEQALLAAHWSEGARMTHMVHPGGGIEPGDSDVVVRVCTTPAEVRVFSQVQSAGFGVPEWVDRVHRVNVVNVRRSNQRFYVAETGSAPAGVCLLLLSGEVAGLYAVATLEIAQKRGVARALVARAAADARELGATTLCLNTAAGGKAEEAFRRLGFEPAFDSKFFVKVPAP